MLQTEEERQLRKMVRREEKKLTRRKDGDRDVDSAQGNFNPQDLRSQRFLSGFKFAVLLLWFVGQYSVDCIFIFVISCAGKAGIVFSSVLSVYLVQLSSSVLSGISGQLLQQLQSAFNAATRLVFSARK